MVYRVKQGDHIASIAFRNGFYNFRTLWDHPANAELKKQRVNPNVLLPGDEVVIPDKSLRSETRPTGQAHLFKLDATELRLRIVLRDVNGDPIPNADCDLIVDSKKKKLTTNAEGRIDEGIPFLAERGSVVVRGQDYQFAIGELDPETSESGQRARLANLGYYLGDGPEIDEEELRSGIEEFQCDYGLGIDGECGPLTQKKLVAVHGC